MELTAYLFGMDKTKTIECVFSDGRLGVPYITAEDYLGCITDGEFNALDKEVAYDFNFAVLTSKDSFSCGNLMPVMAHDEGIAIMGERSGGSCAV